MGQRKETHAMVLLGTVGARRRDDRRRPARRDLQYQRGHHIRSHCRRSRPTRATRRTWSAARASILMRRRPPVRWITPRTRTGCVPRGHRAPPCGAISPSFQAGRRSASSVLPVVPPPVKKNKRKHKHPRDVGLCIRVVISLLLIINCVLLARIDDGICTGGVKTNF